MASQRQPPKPVASTGANLLRVRSPSGMVKVPFSPSDSAEDLYVRTANEVPLLCDSKVGLTPCTPPGTHSLVSTPATSRSPHSHRALRCRAKQHRSPASSSSTLFFFSFSFFILALRFLTSHPKTRHGDLLHADVAALGIKWSDLQQPPSKVARTSSPAPPPVQEVAIGSWSF